VFSHRACGAKILPGVACERLKSRRGASLSHCSIVVFGLLGLAFRYLMRCNYRSLELWGEAKVSMRRLTCPTVEQNPRGSVPYG